jgi:hypothetical protein
MLDEVLDQALDQMFDEVLDQALDQALGQALDLLLCWVLGLFERYLVVELPSLPFQQAKIVSSTLIVGYLLLFFSTFHLVRLARLPPRLFSIQAFS